MARPLLKLVLLNPAFDISSGKLISHEGATFVAEFPIRLDRSIQGSAKQNATTANNLATQKGSTANQVESTLIPGLERDANNPTGFTPVQKNNMLVAGGEAVGGANSGIVGQAGLEAARTRNPGGFAAALSEASRVKGRQLSSNALGVENQDAHVALQKQQQARQMLAGLYGTDTGAQLHAMGLSDEALKTALEAGKSGWQQNAMNWINTLSGAAKTGSDIHG